MVQVCKMLDDEMRGQLFLELLFQKIVTVSKHRHVNCTGMAQTKLKLARVVLHRCHGILTRNTKAPCGPSFHTWLCPELRDLSYTRRSLLAP